MHATVRSLRSGVLSLAVDSSAWRQELWFHRAEIARRMAMSLGKEIHEVKLSIVRQTVPSAANHVPALPTVGPPPLPALSDAGQARFESLTRHLATDGEV